MNILIPKAETEQARWQQSLQLSGHECVFADPWQIDILPQTQAVKQIWMNLDIYRGIICVSPTAAKILMDALDKYWPMPPAEIHWLCNGPRTASVLADAGLSPIYPTNGYTAEDVLALPQATVSSGDKWLIVKGEGGRLTYQQSLTQAGAQVELVDVYRRDISLSTLDSMVESARQCDAIWISSEFLAEQLFKRNPKFWNVWPGQWWVSSSRLGQWAARLNLTPVKTAQGATPEALSQLMQHEINSQ